MESSNNFNASSGMMRENIKCCCVPTKASLVDSCCNFLNSGVPNRVLFYNCGGWQDFPDSVVPIFIDEFRNGKSCIQFSVGNEPLLLDFLSMVLINLRTKSQREIAWTDEAGRYFFPTSFCHNDDGSKEWSFNVVVREEVGETGTSNSFRQVSVSKIENLERDSEDFLSVRNLFLSGMLPFAGPSNIVYIQRHAPKDETGLERKQNFERMIKIVEQERGHANVKYAWFGAKKIEVGGVLAQGFGNHGTNPTEGILGTGFYLTPVGRSFSCVNHCDADRQEILHLILCRVIMGKMEQVRPGSKQYSASNRDYDSGVDNLSQPKCYVLWPTNAHLYVYPEYIVGFKLAPEIREYLFGLRDIRYHVAITEITSDSPALIPVNGDEVKPPNSPWIPFRVLLEAVKDRISPLALELLEFHHQEKKRRIISKDEMVRKFKLIIGDRMLSSVIASYERSRSARLEEHPSKRIRLGESNNSHTNSNNNNG